MGVSKSLKVVQLSYQLKKQNGLHYKSEHTLLFFKTLISKYDFGPVKLPGLSRNRPQVIEKRTVKWSIVNIFIHCSRLSFVRLSSAMCARYRHHRSVVNKDFVHLSQMSMS